MSTNVEAKPRSGMARQLAWYFGALIVVYAAALAIFWPSEGEDPNPALLMVLAYTPLVGALVARFFGGARIQWGRPDRWILVGLIPTIAVLGVYLLGAAVGWDIENASVLRNALIAAPMAIILASLSASVGEEPGWRGFLWPLLRERWGFLAASVIGSAVWWVFHVPVILLGWYGDLSGLPAFTCAVVGMTLFLGVITDRSRAVWPAIIAHGAWNGMAANGFTAGGTPAFSGSDTLMGEFGWLAAITMLIVGVVATFWHMRTMAAPLPARDSSETH